MCLFFNPFLNFITLMRTMLRRSGREWAGLIFLLISLPVFSQEPAAAPAPPDAPPAPLPLEAVPPPAAPSTAPDWAPGTSPVAAPAARRVRRVDRDSDVVFAFNRDARHGVGTDKPDAVVAVGGSCQVEGEVGDAVVAVLGDARVSGNVGESVVAVFGNVYIDSTTDSVVAVLGGVELGPKAVVKHVVSVGGPVVRHPGSQVLGALNELAVVSELPDYTGFRAWVRKCFFWGRPLGIGDDLGWAWTVAGIFLAGYVLFAVVFPRGVERCVETLDTRPGRSLFAAIVSLILTPVVAVILSLTVVGFFLAVALIVFAIAFGKAAVLGWLGRRMMRGLGLSSAQEATALAVLVGGLLVTAIYLIPAAGLMAWMLILIMAHGVGVYTLLLGLRRPRAAGPLPPPFAAPQGEPRPLTGQTAFPSGQAAGVTPGAVGETMGLAAQYAATSGSSASGLEVPLGEAVPLPPPVATVAHSSSVVAGSIYVRAGFWIRMAALAIDIIVVGAISMLVSVGSLFLLILAAYGAVMWKMKGTTIGGIVCGLKVVRQDDRPLDWTVAVVRALGCFLSLVVAGLGFIWVAFDEEKQSWHDKIAGTLVVRLPSGVSLV